MHNEKTKTVFDWINWLYCKSMAATGHSWTRLNGCLRTALIQAIEAGIEFDLDSFEQISSRCQGHYWFGQPDNGECFYSAAVKCRNLSACKSFEAWKKRGPFIYEGERLAIGSELTRDGRRCKVTSFSGDRLTACTYKPGTYKVAGRKTITAEQLRKEESARNAAIRTQPP